MLLRSTLALALMFWSVVGLAQEEEPTWTFKSAKANEVLRKYQGARKKLVDGYAQQRAENRAALIETLEKALKAATTSSDLDDAVAIRDAINVLRLSETVKDPSAVVSRPLADDSPAVSKKEAGRPDDSRIPEDAISFGEHHYKLFPNAVPWLEAAKTCQGLGGHLLRMETAEEFKFVVETVTKGAKKHCWIDGIEKRKNAWYYSNGKSIKRMNWAAGEPDAGGENEHFIVMSASGECSNVPATPNRAFICEWDN